MKNLVNKTHPMLHTIVNDVPVNMYVRDIVYSMWEIMYANKGIGLAAPQVGIDMRIFVMHANGLKQAFINPVITKFYGGKITSKEGCLSYPGIEVNMIRSKQIIIEGFTPDWKPIKRKLKGLAAYCAQHEVDHLNGITIG